MSKLAKLKGKLDGRVYHTSGNLIAFIVKNQPHTVIADRNDDPVGDPADDVLILSGSTPGGEIFRSKSVDQVFDKIQTLR